MAADMYLCNAYYDLPGVETIANYAEELAILLRDGYVSEYEFGFQRNSKRVLSWRYTVREDGSLSTDNRAGKLLSSIDLGGARFFNFLSYSSKWWQLTEAERNSTKSTLPISRTTGEPPSDGNGYWTGQDRQYSSGGVGLDRATFRPYM
jgi:hypothetical protein